RFLPSRALIATVFLVSSLTVHAAGTLLKIGTADITLLFKNYHKTGKQQQAFSEDFAKVQKENNLRLEAIRTLEAEIKKLKLKIEDPLLAASTKREKSQKFRAKIDEARAMNRERQEFIGRRNRALELKKQASMQGILEEIRKHIIEYAKTENYDYVFDKSGLTANQVPLLLYCKDVVDITPKLLDIINKDIAKK
ncbi:MAG: OmpH family outer membrane protein, partial [Akkermansiaceae bacterium]